MEEHRVAERRQLKRQSSFSLRLMDSGTTSLGYIEHSSQGYLAVRGRDICCEPLKREDKSFEHSMGTYGAWNDEHEKIVARTISRPVHCCSSDQSESDDARIYLCVTKERTVSLQKMDAGDFPRTIITDDEEIVFFRIRSVGHDFVCFESTEYELNFLAVEESGVCLKPLNAISDAEGNPTVQFRVFNKVQ